MMVRAISRPHPCHLWTDQRVQALPLSQKRMLDYCWTGPDVNGAGVTAVEPGVFQARVGEIGASVENCLLFLQKADFIVFDTSTQEVFVLDWFRFHQFSSPAGRAAYAKGLHETRSSTLRTIIKERFRLSGHEIVKIDKTVDNSDNPPKNQELNPPASTPTSKAEAEAEAEAEPEPASPPALSDSPLFESALQDLLARAARRNKGTDTNRDEDTVSAARALNLELQLDDETAYAAVMTCEYPSDLSKALHQAAQRRDEEESKKRNSAAKSLPPTGFENDAESHAEGNELMTAIDRKRKAAKGGAQ